MDGTRSLVARRAIARAGGDQPDAAAEAESRLRAAVDDITRLDAEVEALSAALSDFSRRYETALRTAFEDLGLAERLVRRLQALEDGLSALAEGRTDAPEAAGSRRARPGRRSAKPRGERRDPSQGEDSVPEQEDAAPGEAEGAASGPEVEPAAVALKRLYRRLARVLHPDLAQDDAERARLGDLMARVNAAYAKGDLTALEVMAEKLGEGAPLGDLSPEERRAHLERRAATLARIAVSLARERDRIVRSDTNRLREECSRREAEGRDYLEETRAEVEEEAAAAYADALARLTRIARAAREASRARNTAMTKIEKRGPTGARRAFDPLQEGEIVRMGASRLDRQRATPAARELARALESAPPWDVALALLAFFAEDSGGRPPEAVATPDGWAARWERLRPAWPGAPDLARMLARLPRHLVLGARAQGASVVAGVQLASADLLAGVRIAMDREAVARIARDVLAALGPEEACKSCGASGPGVHLLRTRGLDELHGVACAGCGEILKSYWRYGEVDGLEALAPHALRLGLVSEATAQLAGTAVGFQMLPHERDELTADGLRKRFAEVYLTPYEVELAKGALGVSQGKERLPPSALVGARARLRFTIADGTGTTAEELLELLRARIERRFRP